MILTVMINLDIRNTRLYFESLEESKTEFANVIWQFKNCLIYLKLNM